MSGDEEVERVGMKRDDDWARVWTELGVGITFFFDLFFLSAILLISIKNSN